MIYVDVDIAKLKHFAIVMTADGEVLVPPLRTLLSLITLNLKNLKVLTIMVLLVMLPISWFVLSLNCYLIISLLT